MSTLRPANVRARAPRTSRATPERVTPPFVARVLGLPPRGELGRARTGGGTAACDSRVPRRVRGGSGAGRRRSRFARARRSRARASPALSPEKSALAAASRAARGGSRRLRGRRVLYLRRAANPAARLARDVRASHRYPIHESATGGRRATGALATCALVAGTHAHGPHAAAAFVSR